MKNLSEVLRGIKMAGLLEDRREYSIEDLATMYDLNPAEATLLFAMIAAEFD